jgi:hypothetical protein
MEEVKIGSKYLHFKGKHYRVVALARDCDNPQRQLVVYQALYESPDFGKDQVWTRELNDFLGYKELDGKKIKKFTLVSG